MSEKAFTRNSIYFTAIVTIGICSLLAWDYYHGGVPSHHFLAQKEMPAISNWWGGLLVPLLTWFLLYRIKQRVYGSNDSHSESPNFLRRELYGFLGALLFGILISVLFTSGQNDIAGNLMLGLFVFAFLFPIHRPECLLGFVLGMTFTFGGVLPIIIGMLLGIIFMVLYRVIRPAVFYVGAKIAFLISANRRKLNS
ncbi:hypothetical protein I2I05_04780 [Hymenobacter sp. BT683]|uniref:Uncharacterized protein n=1 Tax=Hymenobacter jeongseonensis TaxID=2791027 RepID=A0ABS0IEC7_9BACT|nr:hypothetical protein [Hymenobacter jeongseonensis]MBF9236702.1 hypothetical protein [Hymenobacter jeongseonensis]